MPDCPSLNLNIASVPSLTVTGSAVANAQIGLVNAPSLTLGLTSPSVVVTSPETPNLTFFPIGRRAGVISLNGLSGALNLVGGEGVSVSISGNSILINTTSGQVTSLSGYITTGNADLRYYPLGSNPSGYLTGFNSGDYATIQNLYQTGSDLYNLIQNITAGVSQINGLSGSLGIVGNGSVTITESGNNIVISGLDTDGTGDYVSKYTQQRFKALVATGFDSYYINYPNPFDTSPIVNTTLETASIYSYMMSSQNVSNTGFKVTFSDDILETGVYINILAQID